MSEYFKGNEQQILFKIVGVIVFILVCRELVSWLSKSSSILSEIRKNHALMSDVKSMMLKLVA